jgi:hypothetical protein
MPELTMPGNTGMDVRLLRQVAHSSEWYTVATLTVWSATPEILLNPFPKQEQRATQLFVKPIHRLHKRFTASFGGPLIELVAMSGSMP